MLNDDYLVIREQYVKSVKMCMQYWRLQVLTPRNIEKDYRNKLELFRYKLDQMGMKMPLPQYDYEKNNRHTWKYLDHIVYEKEYIGEVRNPYFNPRFGIK